MTRSYAFSLLAASLMLASASAEAASFMTWPNIQTGQRFTSNNAVLLSRTHDGNTPHEPPPIPRYSGNDPFDSSSNLNPAAVAPAV